ncbi:uncharacterized protein LOC131239391 [Magnolia sinica]|uniref:uncharacterized protein LOC131239391 n=1 Tax=Magnolia sinica TaxID=86752 RepID=UPI0026584CA3|nr:uncharacterized protein LOC131239391 [Magnolia sinica]
MDDAHLSLLTETENSSSENGDDAANAGNDANGDDAANVGDNANGDKAGNAGNNANGDDAANAGNNANGDNAANEDNANGDNANDIVPLQAHLGRIMNVVDMIGMSYLLFSYFSGILTIIFSPPRRWVGGLLLCCLVIAAIIWSYIIQRRERERAPAPRQVAEGQRESSCTTTSC